MPLSQLSHPQGQKHCFPYFFFSPCSPQAACAWLPSSSFLSTRSLRCYLLATDAKAPCRQKTGDRAPAAEHRRGRAPLRPPAMVLRQPRARATVTLGDLARWSWRSGNPASARRWPSRPRPPVMALRQPRIGATWARSGPGRGGGRRDIRAGGGGAWPRLPGRLATWTRSGPGRSREGSLAPCARRRP